MVVVWCVCMSVSVRVYMPACASIAVVQQWEFAITDQLCS